MSAKYFDAPIPGQSLTDVPGNARWEHPPKFVDLEEALEFIWQRVSHPTQMGKLLALLDRGVPVASLAGPILMSGFMEGLWTPDLAALMAGPLCAMIAAMGKRAGIKVKATAKTKTELEEFLEQLGPADGEDLPPAANSMIEEAPAEAPRPKTGLLGMVGK